METLLGGEIKMISGHADGTPQLGGERDTRIPFLIREIRTGST